MVAVNSEHLNAALTYPFRRLFDPADPLCLLWMFCAILFVAGSYVVSRAGRRLVSPRQFLGFIFAKRVLLHPSALLDYKLFIVNSIVFAGVLSLMIATAPLWRDGTVAVLTAIFGVSTAAGTPSIAILVMTTLLQLLAYDFGYWLGHWMMHIHPVLWEFHKVHHSAEVMTPATEWRQHPVEFVVVPTIYGITSGLTIGVMAYAFGETTQMLSAHGQTLVMLAHLATFHHIRHSHIWIPFTSFWGYLLHSPAHHQIHHSADEKHHGTNMGFMLSIWDWAAGTLCIPKDGERVQLGIGPEGRTHDTVLACYARPCWNAAILIRREIATWWCAVTARRA